MKFAKVLEQTLIEEEIPEEWLEAAIQYKSLKKCISKVVKELKFLGLDQNSLKLLLEDTASSEVVELDETDTSPSNPIIAEYTLTKSSTDGHIETIKPMLKLTLDYSNQNYTDDHIYELGLQLKHKIESVLNTDDDTEEVDEEHIDQEKIVEIKEENDELVITPVTSHSREGSPPLGEGLGSVDETLAPHPKKNEIFIMLNSDTKFFLMLNDELEKLDVLKRNEEKKLFKEVESIGALVSSLSNLKFSNSDIYKWRELFRIYLDSEVYFKYNETSVSSSERDSEHIKKNLLEFMTNVEKSGILTEFKNKKSMTAFNQFLAMNYHLLKVLQFQSINNEAFRKILKKFDKRTSLGIKYKFPKLVSNEHIFITGTSLAQSVCYIIQSSVLTLIPQLDDYTCLICTSIAFKPIRLECGHMFCVRCLVKLKQQDRNNCPVCRHDNAILLADGSNLDMETMTLMKRFFPKEVKEKLKERSQERYDEIKGKGKQHDKCEVI